MLITRVVALAAAGFVVLSGSAVDHGALSARPTTTPANTDTATALVAENAAYTVTMKPAGHGNGSRGLNAYAKAPASAQASVGIVVVDANWSELESSRGVYNTTAIDSQLAAAAKEGLRVRIRVIAGTQAPDYVKRIGGAAIPFYDHQGKSSTTIGRFWTTRYQNRWQKLMTHLAGKYDTNARVAEVNISGTGTVSAEVMLTMGNDTLPGSSITNNSRLLSAGATEAARRAALTNDIAFMQNTWAHTHTTLFCHSYTSLEPSVKGGMTTTDQIINATYAAKPGATVFGHTGASELMLKGVTHKNTLGMYTFILAHNYPFMAQTQAYSGGAKNEGVGDLAYVLTWLANHGAFSTELPAGWQSDASALKVLATTSAQMTVSERTFGG
jgi:hypothetical protein